MNNSMRNIVCCLTAAILLVTTSGCEWLFPLTSPSRARVDKQLLGYWKMTNLGEPNGSRSIVAFSEVAKLSQTFLAANPNVPRGAMFLTGLTLNQTPTPDDGFWVFWPTQIGNTSYANFIVYDMKTKKLQTGSAYWIGKYVVTGDSVTMFGLGGDAKTRITSSLGNDYNSSDLLQEITKATEWEPYWKLDRIRF